MVMNSMNNQFQFPSQQDSDREKKLPNDPSFLLEELAKIRQNIEQDSSCPSANTEQTTSSSKENSVIFESVLNSENVNQNSTDDQKSSLKSEFCTFYRFDRQHVDEQVKFNDEKSLGQADVFSPMTGPLPNKTVFPQDRTQYDFPSENSRFDQRANMSNQRETENPAFFPQSPPSERNCPSDPIQKDEPKRESEDAKDHRRFDDAPVVIPIYGPQRKKSQPSRSVFRSEDRAKTHGQGKPFEHRQANSPIPPTLPWQAFSQYENETFFRLAANASTCSLFIGWGAIACGILIFIRSLFVGSMVWLNYGLPVLSLGAVCLFLGIILSILAEKMQQINELKQTLTTQRILGKSNRVPPSPVDAESGESTVKAVFSTSSLSRESEHFKNASEQENASQSAPMTFDSDEGDINEIYDRLLKLRSEINELINEYETP